MGQDSPMLQAALQYHDEGLCIIPVRPKEKAPAIEWEQYQTTRSTREEVLAWWSNGRAYNIGAVHGEVSGGYVLLDVDKDAGLYEALRSAFPALLAGRIVRSGGGAGYHIPLMVATLPNFGKDDKQDRPRGNRTWKTDLGSLNVRARNCQSVLPPSIHPSGNPYVFLQAGPITQVPDLRALIGWLDRLAPPTQERPAPTGRGGVAPTTGDTLINAVRTAWPTALDVFEQFGIGGELRREPDGETRILGHGGLIVNDDKPDTWYNFSAEEGGGPIEAWAWCRFGSVSAKRQHLRQILLEMAQAAGVDTARFYQRGDETATRPGAGDRQYWSGQYSGRWEHMR